jgi:hypothetical protein
VQIPNSGAEPTLRRVSRLSVRPPPRLYSLVTMPVTEAPLRETRYGLVADVDGWFVLNARDSRWRDFGPRRTARGGCRRSKSTPLGGGVRIVSCWQHARHLAGFREKKWRICRWVAEHTLASVGAWDGPCGRGLRWRETSETLLYAPVPLPRFAFPARL